MTWLAWKYIYEYKYNHKYKYQYIDMTFLATKVYPWNMSPVAESGVSEDIWTFETRALRSCKLYKPHEDFKRDPDGDGK